MTAFLTYKPQSLPSVRLCLPVIMASEGSVPTSSPAIPLAEAMGVAQASKSLNASFKGVMKTWRSPQKYLLGVCDTAEKQKVFGQALKRHLPSPYSQDVDYHIATGMVTDSTYIVHPSSLGFTKDCSPKLEVAREAFIKIMEEMLMDGFVAKAIL